MQAAKPIEKKSKEHEQSGKNSAWLQINKKPHYKYAYDGQNKSYMNDTQS